MRENNSLLKTIFVAALFIGFIIVTFLVIQLLINARKEREAATPQTTTSSPVSSATTSPTTTNTVPPVTQPSGSGEITTLITTQYTFTEIAAGSQKINEVGYFDSLDNLKKALCLEAPMGILEKCLVQQKDATTAIALVEAKFEDDSVAGGQTIYRISYSARGWAITGKQEKHRCQTGRGNTDWTFELCV